MQNQRTMAVRGVKAGGAAIVAALALSIPNLAAAGEREEALSLCRAKIAETFQVTADESGAHFQESATSARAYTMRFQVRTADNASRAVACKVKRGALVVVALNPPAAAAPGSADKTPDAGPVLAPQPGR